MNGAQHLVATLVECGVTTCFTNPGTSEMHFVAALDGAAQVGQGLRCVLCLFEGVATGAADGFGRMVGGPAATLLHTGPGLANGLANLHNARRAGTPMVNIVGDHAGYHRGFDAPLTSDVSAVAAPFSHWIGRADTASQVAAAGARAVAAAKAPPGRIATLILPADTAWTTVQEAAPVSLPVVPEPTEVAAATIDTVAQVLRQPEPRLMLLGGRALGERGQRAAGRIAAATGAEIMAPMACPRLERGEGCLPLERVPYPVDMATERLGRYRHAVLVGVPEPVAFFAYPGKPSRLLSGACRVISLSRPGEDGLKALEDLADALDAGRGTLALETRRVIEPPVGPLTIDGLALAVAAALPDNAIVVDESLTSGRALFPNTRGAPRHSWLQLTGGAIGIGLPLGLGAAVACPERPVIVLQADGSGLYTLQALWSQAREGVNVTSVILSNRAYAILQGEMRHVGANPGATARDLMSLDRPAIDWVALGKGFGVPGERVDRAEELHRAILRGVHTPGPYLIEAELVGVS
ncbi:MAG: acetolactate synthase large subunit [Candidatus Competibacterales bacterium]